MNYLYNTANAAGFAETTQCVGENDPTPWCPDVPSGVACGAIDDPVKCGPTNCVYSNYCNANAAGFVPNDCRSVSCPDPVGNCVANYDPIRCGEKGCIYANDCEGMLYSKLCLAAYVFSNKRFHRSFPANTFFFFAVLTPKPLVLDGMCFFMLDNALVHNH